MTPDAATRLAGGAGAVLASALAAQEDALLTCVHCGFCLPACPTYTRLGDENDSPRGRLYLMEAVVEGRVAPQAEAFRTHIDRCLGCRACEPVCPSGVRYGFLLERARDLIARETGTDWMARASLRVFGSGALTRLASLGGRIVRSAGLAGGLARALPRRFGRTRMALAMLAASRPAAPPRRESRPSSGPAVRTEPGLAGSVAAPPGTGRTGEAAAARESAPAPDSGGRRSAVGGRRPKAALLRGCVQQGLFARVNRATRTVLEANGCEVVEVSGEVCCGALHAHNGALDGARELARRNVRAFMAVDPDIVVVNAAGCGAMMKEYGDLLEDDPELAGSAETLASKVRDLFEYLAEREVVVGAPLPVRVTYDAPCHLVHGQGVTDAPLDVLRTIPELELVPLPDADECCGGAGIYGMTHPELGGRILEDKLNAVRSTGADVVVTPNPGCQMQIGGGLVLAGDDVRVMHPVELLAESYRRRGS